MSRRPTKPQLRRRSGLSPPLPRQVAFHFACPEALPARFWHGAFLSPLTVAARKREPDRRTGARLGAQLRGVRGSWAVASGCGAPDRFGDRPSSPCLLDAALAPSRRWRAVPVAARRASASAVFVFAIHAPHSPAEHGARSVRPSPLRRRRPPPDVTGHSSLPGTGAPRRRREKNVGAQN